jgi:putative chitinase
MPMPLDWIATQRNLKQAGYDPGLIDGDPGMMTYRAALNCAARRDTGEFGLKAGGICAAMFPKYGISASPNSLAQFLATTPHETGDYTVFEENLYYTTPARLVKNWPSRFNLASAVLYLRNPRKLAEKVYGGRYGNPPGRAYDYRGGGWIQTTFYANYLAAQQATGLPLVDHPELLHDPLTSIEAACAYWKARGCNEMADQDPSGRKSRVAVNGGTIGLEDVLERTARLRRIFV